jgi:glyoxylase-like metal-dependent hydrolase (beta-lactamase superfamily II)
MKPADDFQQVTAAIALWHQYDPASKTELFSTAIDTPDGLLLIDPILLTAPAESALLASRTVAGIVVTSHNHWRASEELARKFGVPRFAHSSTSNEARLSFSSLSARDKIFNGVEIIALEGAAPGEIALYSSAEEGTLILGDALIHFEPYGFTFLPPKYCTDYKKMRKSLRDLLTHKAKRLLFAHGMPIVSDADGRLRQLLNDGGT